MILKFHSKLVFSKKLKKNSKLTFFLLKISDFSTKKLIKLTQNECIFFNFYSKLIEFTQNEYFSKKITHKN